MTPKFYLPPAKQALSILLIMIGFAWPASSQRLVTFERTMIYKSDDVFDLVLTMAIPQDVPGSQDVLDIQYSAHFARTYSAGGIKYAEFTTRKGKDYDTIRISSLLVLYDRDMGKTPKLDSIINPGQSYKHYLIAEDNLQIDNKRILAIADSITGDNEVEIAEGIFDFVVDRLDYHSFELQDRGAAKALRQQAGDCTEYSELMVALARAKGIPARVVYGAVAKTTRSNVYHNWVELHFEEYGWVPFDPTHADCEGCPTTFTNMENKYVYYGFGNFPWLAGWTSSTNYASLQSRVSKGQRQFVFPSVRMEYKLTDHTAEFLDKAKEAYEQGDRVSAASLVDTLLLSGYITCDGLLLRGNIFTDMAQYEEALEFLREAARIAENDNERGRCSYSFARYFGATGNTSQAVNFVRKAKEYGYRSSDIRDDPALYSIHNMPEFDELCARDIYEVAEHYNLHSRQVSMFNGVMERKCRGHSVHYNRFGVDFSKEIVAHNIREILARRPQSTHVMNFDRNGNNVLLVLGGDTLTRHEFDSSGRLLKSESPQSVLGDSVVNRITYAYNDSGEIELIRKENEVKVNYDIPGSNTAINVDYSVDTRREGDITRITATPIDTQHTTCVYQYNARCELERFETIEGKDTIQIVRIESDSVTSFYLIYKGDSLLLLREVYDELKRLIKRHSLVGGRVTDQNSNILRYAMNYRFHYEGNGSIASRIELDQVQLQGPKRSDYRSEVTVKFGKDGLPSRIKIYNDDGIEDAEEKISYKFW